MPLLASLTVVMAIFDFNEADNDDQPVREDELELIQRTAQQHRDPDRMAKLSDANPSRDTTRLRSYLPASVHDDMKAEPGDAINWAYVADSGRHAVIEIVPGDR